MNSLKAVIAVLILTSGVVLAEKSAGTNDGQLVENTGKNAAGLWTSPVDIRSENLFYGVGGTEHQPGKSLRFLKEDTAGSNPKFDVQDENGVKWKVKLGPEAKPETVATRLLWAVGYHVDEDYFVRTLEVRDLPAHLHRGGNLVQHGRVEDARLERSIKSFKKGGSWHWRDAPFAGTREYNGLRTMMALVNNWDLKDENNTVFERHGERIYEVSDLGATFGTNGVLLVKKTAKGNLHSYQHSKFITKVSEEYVDFATPALPSFPYLFNPFQYGRRARLRWIGKHVSRADAKWMGELLGQLSADQIRDAFRAGGYSPEQVTGYHQILARRIAELKGL